MQHLRRAVRIALHAGVVAATIPLLTGVAVTSGSAQEQPGPSAAAPPGGRSTSCNEFRDLVKEPEPGAGSATADTVEKKYSRLSDATKAAEACAKAITESFRTLREQGGGKSSWSGIEQALDGFIKGQQSFIDRIEGAGGLIEEAARGESVAQQRIEEAQRNYPDEVDREKERLARLKDIVAATTQQKDVLAKEIRRLQANKPRIAFSEGGKQFDMAIDSLDQFNKVLEGFTKKIPKNQVGSSGM